MTTQQTLSIRQQIGKVIEQTDNAELLTLLIKAWDKANEIEIDSPT